MTDTEPLDPGAKVNPATGLYGCSLYPITPDPRIEAVAKLLFTGPMFCGNLRDWDSPRWALARGTCHMSAEDVLRGIDEAAEWQYRIVDRIGIRYTTDPEDVDRAQSRGITNILRRRPEFKRAATEWEPLP